MTWLTENPNRKRPGYTPWDGAPEWDMNWGTGWYTEEPDVFYPRGSQQPDPAPVPEPGSGGGGGGWSAPEAPEAPGGGTPPYRPTFNFPRVPVFRAPQFRAPVFSYDERFVAPDATSIANDPGYQFRLSQGQKALEQSAAGRGVLRTGGTLKDILGYGQNFASQEYGNAFDRARQTFDTNYGVARDVFDRLYTGEKDMFDARYTGAKDEFAPQLLDYNNRFDAERQAGLAALENMWRNYFFNNVSATDAFKAGL